MQMSEFYLPAPTKPGEKIAKYRNGRGRHKPFLVSIIDKKLPAFPVGSLPATNPDEPLAAAFAEAAFIVVVFLAIIFECSHTGFPSLSAGPHSSWLSKKARRLASWSASCKLNVSDAPHQHRTPDG